MDILLILYEYSSDFLHYIIFLPPSLEATRCCNYERAPNGAEHVARDQCDRYVLFLIQSVIIKCEIQCRSKRLITLLNNVYLKACYIINIIAYGDRACARTQLPIPHILFQMIITATWK